MTLGRPYRALALPALAILVPSALIAVLAFQWLSMAQEASRLLGAEAAGAALAGLRHDLRAMLTDTARGLLPRLILEPHALPESDSAWPAIVSEAFLFDSAGHAVGDRRAPPDDAPAGPSRRAADLLAAGTQALSVGRFADADRSAVQLMACCGGTRDEYGVTYAFYAASQRLAIDSRRPDASRPQAVVRQLREAIDRGDLNRSADVVSIRLLAEELGDTAGASGLVSLVEQRVAAATRAQEGSRLAEAWVSSLDWGTVPDAGVLVGAWRNAASATLISAWRARPDQEVVLVIEPQALRDWVSRASDARSSFAFALDSAPASNESADAVLTAPLFPETPALAVIARRGPEDPTADRRRQQLFMAAAGAGLVLTLVAGYFAARDVFRELRTASLRSTFLAGVTHEIKTPLTSIRLLAETLQQGRASPQASAELLSTIVGETEHLSGLVDNVLGTARVESGTRTYQKKPISLTEVVRSARRRFDYTLTKEGFTLVESIAPSSIWVRADPDALAQAVLNLLGNATKYSGASREIRLGVTATDSHASISVADHGLGVPRAEQSRIFNSFYRARSTSAETTGTGLGLALVRHFAEAHGGRVALESEPGRGSTFTITLPVADPPRAEGSANG